MITVSKYSDVGAYMATAMPLLLIGLMIVLIYLTVDALSGGWDSSYSFLMLCLTFMLALLSGWLAFFSFKQYSKKEIDKNILRYYLPYLPFLVVTKNMEDFDRKVYVKTYDRHRRIVDGIWLLKEGKLRLEMYSDVFSNLEELGKAIKLPEAKIKDPVLTLPLVMYQLGLKRVRV